MLLDRFNREHTYLRISLTDQCNFRCTYCMPFENMQFMPNHELMQRNEIYELAKVFVDHGIKKIRLTGGEPLVRKDFASIATALSDLPVELTMTTNGVLLDKYLQDIKTAGMKSINISLDTLNPERFKEITKRDHFQRVWDNILLMFAEGFKVKINAVAKKGWIDKELLDFISLTKDLPLHVRFIEFMPFDGNLWASKDVITANMMLKLAASKFSIEKLIDPPHDTAKKYKVTGFMGTFAFITTMSEHFCSSCNRLRLTADGKLKNCLFGKDEIDLLSAFRQGADIVPLIKKGVLKKHAVMGGQFPVEFTNINTDDIENRSMISIGG